MKQKLDINSPRNKIYKESYQNRMVHKPFQAAMSAVGLVEDKILPMDLRFNESAKEFAKAINPEKVAEVEAPKISKVKDMGSLNV